MRRFPPPALRLGEAVAQLRRDRGGDAPEPRAQARRAVLPSHRINQQLRKSRIVARERLLAHIGE
jgi:hypothetical protein